VTISNPSNGQIFDYPQTIDIEANATDNGSITKVEFFAGTGKLGEDNTAPYSFSWSGMTAGDYSLTAKATDDIGETTVSSAVAITIKEACVGSGTLTREYWGGVPGSSVSDIPLNKVPTSTNQVWIFEGPSNIGIHYGTRISGYICVPVSGTYRFYISSNDNSQLWLSSNEDPANKTMVASVTGSTNIRQWNKYPSQQSTAITLTKGKSYYIEALHKQGVGSDHIAVGWQLPGGVFETPIPGNRLSPFMRSQSALAMQATTTESVNNEDLFSQINIYPNPSKTDSRLKISGYRAIREKTDTSVEIISMTGEIVYTGKIKCGGNCEDDYPVEIQGQMVPGLYVVNLVTNGKRHVKRLLVK
jgi:hypothetical protein